MGAKKVAAGLTTAGIVFIAGCSGGSGNASLSGGLPTTPQNAKKLSLSLTIPGAPSYLTMAARPSPFGKNARRGAQSHRVVPQVVRKPKFVGNSVASGGYIVLDIYQNGQLASYQTFTVGFGNPYTDFNCTQAPPLYFSLQCTNTTNIYAPGGSDTFYAETQDSQHRLISLTPGFPGTSVYGTAPTPVTIPSSSAVQIQTYGVPAALYVDNASPCVASASAGFHIADVAGDFMVGALAYPVTFHATGGFGVQYDGTPLGSSATVYNAQLGYAFASTSSGQTGALTAQTAAGNLAVNFPTLYSVDETALTAVAGGGLYAIGLVEGSSSSYACGQIPLTSLYTGQTVTFANPVGMSQDGNSAITVLDNGGSNPTVYTIIANGLFIGPSIVPVVATTLSSTGGDDIAASLNEQAYVVNADGTIHRVDYSLPALYPFSYSTAPDTAIAGGLTAPAGSSISALTNGTFDYVFATSYSTSFLYEVDNANTGSPAGGPFNLTGDTVGNVYAGMLSSSTVTTATASDYTNLYATFRGWDGINTDAVIVTCTLYSGTPCLSNAQVNSFGSVFGGAGSFATQSTVPAVLATLSNTVVGIYETNSASSFGFVPTFTPNPNRIVVSPDGTFAGVQVGTSFYFSSASTLTPSVGSLTGAVSTIWNSPFF
jgi:hypothetical protein